MLGKPGEGSSADGCSELEGGGGDGLLLLLVSLLKTGDWLLPLLWMGLEGQSSPGCFFWTSAQGRAGGSRENKTREQSRSDGVSANGTFGMQQIATTTSLSLHPSLHLLGLPSDASTGLD